MARPTTKDTLTEASSQQFSKLWELINSMTEEEQAAQFNFSDSFLQKQKEAHWERDKNLRDILVHLYEWHQLLLRWVQANQNDESKPFLPEPYTWKTYGQMNVGFWEDHQNTPLPQAKEMLNKSHAEVMETIGHFSNEELFTKKHFSWTGTTSLGSYCISATSSHYDWAIKKLKQHIRSTRA